MTNPQTIRTPKRRARFLEMLSEHAIVGRAADAAGASRNAFYRWRREDPEFAADWDEAVDPGISAVDDEALRRALEGEETPVFDGGKQVGVTRKFSERFLMFMLKARRPEVYSDRAAMLAAERRTASDEAEREAEAEVKAAAPAADDDFDIRDFLRGRGWSPPRSVAASITSTLSMPPCCRTTGWTARTPPGGPIQRPIAAWPPPTPRDDGRRAPPGV